MQLLAGIINEDGEEETAKTSIGHTDDERTAIKKQLFQMGKYCVELYKMLDSAPDNADFPHWWQAKIIKANDYIGSVKHYLENDINVPDADHQKDNVVVTPDAEDFSDPSGVS